MLRTSRGSKCLVLFAFFAFFVLALGASGGPAQAQESTAQIILNAVQGAVQSAVQSARDRVYDQQQVRRSTNRPLGFSDDPEADKTFGPFSALGYASMPTKAPPPPSSPAPTLTSAMWASGTAAFDNVSGAATSNSSTYTALGGADFTWSNLAPYNSSFLIGVLGGNSWSYSSSMGSTTNTTVPTVGAYAAYIVGGFSTDASFITSFIHSEPPAPASSTDQTSYTYAQNLNYRFTLTDSVSWFEPTAGFSYTEGVWSSTQAAAGFQNLQIVRLQAGARLGTSWTTGGGVRVEPTLTGLVYSDVSVIGGGLAIIAGTPTSPNDQGQVWGKGDLKLNFVFNKNFSASIEGAVYGTDNEIGYSGTGGLRWTW